MMARDGRRKSLFETGMEAFLFNARWLMAPFYVGLVLMLAFLIVMAISVVGFLFLRRTSSAF